PRASVLAPVLTAKVITAVPLPVTPVKPPPAVVALSQSGTVAVLIWKYVAELAVIVVVVELEGVVPGVYVNTAAVEALNGCATPTLTTTGRSLSDARGLVR